MYIWRLGAGSADEHPHLMSRQKRLYDSPCLLHRLQRRGYSELYLFFLILSRIIPFRSVVIPRGDNRRFRFRQNLILSHADNAHVSEANNIYPKIFIVLLFQFISILLKKNRYLTSNIELYFFTYSFQNCSSLSRSSVPSSLRKQPIIASITVLTPL